MSRDRFEALREERRKRQVLFQGHMRHAKREQVAMLKAELAIHEECWRGGDLTDPNYIKERASIQAAIDSAWQEYLAWGGPRSVAA